ncbi:MAG: glycoside hydrolase family 16 protein [Prevotellaceae bacterium]|jgi:beta-glucanase (GH16 family)|nr:glycoside hydrolase family 16 protein [Prevotellaceae bacterium]
MKIFYKHFSLSYFKPLQSRIPASAVSLVLLCCGVILNTSSVVASETFLAQDDTAKQENYVPAGYSLVWSDEFDNDKITDKWWYETGDHGWGNKELQNYVAGRSGLDTCAEVSSGILKISAKKKDNQVISIRMNSRQSWIYGYFESRMKLPSGKGTWPAFWMLPQNIKDWPDDGEIDIMEEVGYNPNYVSSSIHCKAYNHVAGTQKTSEKFVPSAQSEFHIYAVEWTENYIYAYIDGKRYFTFVNDKQGDKNTWPFNVPFYLKLNLAWGGNWGGAKGVDENVLPAVYEIDYVRVYQDGAKSQDSKNQDGTKSQDYRNQDGTKNQDYRNQDF